MVGYVGIVCVVLSVLSGTGGHVCGAGGHVREAVVVGTDVVVVVAIVVVVLIVGFAVGDIVGSAQ